MPTTPSSGLYRKPCKKQHRQRTSKEDREEKKQKAKRVWGNEGRWGELWSGANKVGLQKTSATTSWGQPQRGPEHSDKLGPRCLETSHGRLQASGRHTIGVRAGTGAGRQRWACREIKSKKIRKKGYHSFSKYRFNTGIIHALTIILTKLHWKLKPPKMNKEVKSDNNNNGQW